jgi:hypothetical protein
MTRFTLRICSCSIAIAVAACGASQRPAPAGPATSPTTPSGVAGPTSSTDPNATPNAAPAGADPMCASHPDELGPWVLTADQMNQRVGTGVTALASIPTTKDHTIEVCGVAAENQWLAASTCANGSHPYASPDQVEQTRAGNVGPGGRCGGIIDLYKVPCPERTYDVYIDMNLCGPGESFM